jgi:hypothetical protein
MKAYVNDIGILDSTSTAGYLDEGQRCMGPECGIDLCKVMHRTTGDTQNKHLYLEPVKSIGSFQTLSPPLLSKKIQEYYNLKY